MQDLIVTYPFQHTHAHTCLQHLNRTEKHKQKPKTLEQLIQNIKNVIQHLHTHTHTHTSCNSTIDDN